LYGGEAEPSEGLHVVRGLAVAALVVVKPERELGADFALRGAENESAE
jgi:hypothetical protein